MEPPAVPFPKVFDLLSSYKTCTLITLKNSDLLVLNYAYFIYKIFESELHFCYLKPWLMIPTVQ